MPVFISYGGSALATKALLKPVAMTQKYCYSVLALSVLCAGMSSAQAKTYENGFELAGGGKQMKVKSR